VTGLNLKKGEKERKVTPHYLKWLPRALRQALNSFSILNLSIGQFVLSRGILIVAWMKPSA
jgi:hypothetical protein